jgi:COP9 signalosome complex subunit 5|eukprot:TRINITY_DN5635_c0_g1_i1.p1 TRINITY_DN5635_c0_g1~~TRINITY_DN5635_c0_g1_i1.p1  ORF type:complete len:343 (+),score=130.90 TRINITY_DN5635_c0_g1_i1:69-1097(+)
MATKTALKTWEANNNVRPVVDDEVYRLDPERQKQLLNARPWRTDPRHFKDVRMSALALLKIQMHAGAEVKPGQVPMEVMGLMQGKLDGQTVIVTDSFAVPIPAGVDRGATHVNPGQEAMEYMVQYLELIKHVGKSENVVGWYHSHPGYGCWLSGIDVSTQRTQQQYNDPFLAVVVDPVRSIGAGKVEIGAFRTFAEGYNNAGQASEWQSVPADRIEDFGVHAKCYYQLEMSFYKSSLDAKLLDLQWRRYWVNTLAASPLTNNRDHITNQIADVAEKLEKTEADMGHGRYGGLALVPSDKKKSEEESQLARVTRDATKVAGETLHGLSRQVLKAALFNGVGTH